MAKEVDSSWLPSDFISDDLFFMEADQSGKPEAKSGASVDNSLFSGSHSRSLVSTTPDCLTAEGEEEDHLARLTLRMAQSFLVDEEDESDGEVCRWPCHACYFV